MAKTYLFLTWQIHVVFVRKQPCTQNSRMGFPPWLLCKKVLVVKNLIRWTKLFLMIRSLILELLRAIFQDGLVESFTSRTGYRKSHKWFQYSCIVLHGLSHLNDVGVTGYEVLHLQAVAPARWTWPAHLPLTHLHQEAKRWDRGPVGSSQFRRFVFITVWQHSNYFM